MLVHIRLATALAALFLFSGRDNFAQPAIPDDDNYTVSSRHASNRAAHHEFQQPFLAMVAGQPIQPYATDVANTIDAFLQQVRVRK